MTTHSLRNLTGSYINADKFSIPEAGEIDGEYEAASQKAEELKTEFNHALLRSVKGAILEQLDLESGQKAFEKLHFLERERNTIEAAQEVVLAFDLKNQDSFHPRLDHKLLLRHVSEEGRSVDFQVTESDRVLDELSTQHPDFASSFRRDAVSRTILDITRQIESTQELIGHIESEITEDRATSRLVLENLVGHKSRLTRMETFRNLLRQEQCELDASKILSRRR